MILCGTGTPACASSAARGSPGTPRSSSLKEIVDRRRRGPRNAPVSVRSGVEAPSPARKCLSLRHHEPSKQAARSIEREVFSFQQLLFIVPNQPLLFAQATVSFFGIDPPLLCSRSTASFFGTHFAPRPRERMRLRARAKWVPPHGYD